MKLTCLSGGKGFHCPPCHILNVGGFHILLECPLDLSALTVFAPISVNGSRSGDIVEQEEERDNEASFTLDGLINSLPWYKTVASLGLWDLSLIDIVLISSPMGFLGLPILTRNSNFSAKIYATKVATKFGHLMMNDLVSLHEESLQFYGPLGEHENPEWMQWSELEKLPQVIRTIILGKVAEELGSWFPLYKKSEIGECIKKVEVVTYAEKSCYNSSLILKAFSSGLEIGSANWTISSPGITVTYLSSSIFKSSSAMEFNYNDLQGADFTLFSDFSSLSDSVFNCGEHISKEVDEINEKREPEEKEKVNFICSCMVDTIRSGGSALVPIGRIGVMLQLLEEISQALEALELKVPVYVISPGAEEMLALANVIPEWLDREHQNKMYSGLSMFDHAELIKDKRLQIFPVIHSPDLIEEWREPCIVFSPHWTLRLGPAVHLLRRWHADARCLLILESEIDADLALLPFAPILMKVLRCSFLSGIQIKKVQPLLEFLKPKHLLFPEVLRTQIPLVEEKLTSILYYQENRTLSAPSINDDVEAHLSFELARQLRPRKTPNENMAIARLEAKLQLHNGMHLLIPQRSPPDLIEKRFLWGAVNTSQLLSSLKDRGIESSLEVVKEEDGDHCRIMVQRPSRGLIDMEAEAPLMITTADKELAVAIRKAVCMSFEGI